MSNARFPKLPGLTWNNKFTDEFFTLIQQAAAPGFETRVSLGPDPIIHFELEYAYLRETGFSCQTSEDELCILRGFYRARQGDFDSFLLYLPDLTQNAADGTVTMQPLFPDANNIAPLIVTCGGYEQNIYEAFGVNGDPGTAPVIYFGGSPIGPTDYNIVGPGFSVAGTTYPGLAVQFLVSTMSIAVSATFSWYYRVRFEKGMQEFESFLAYLYGAQKVQLMTTRTS
jgi:hypothetical protein